MPLLKVSTLEPELVSIFGTTNKAGTNVGENLARAFMNYAMGVQNAGGGTFLGMGGFVGMQTELRAIYGVPNAVGTKAGQDIARAIHNGWFSVQTLFQTIMVPELPSFITTMGTIFSTPNQQGSKFAMDVAGAIDLYCKKTVITGVVPGTPPLLFSSPAT